MGVVSESAESLGNKYVMAAEEKVTVGKFGYD